VGNHQFLIALKFHTLRIADKTEKIYARSHRISAPNAINNLADTQQDRLGVSTVM